VSVGVSPQGLLKSKCFFYKAFLEHYNFKLKGIFVFLDILTIVIYRWRLFHILRSEQYKMLIMSVIKFCLGRERGRNMQILKETFCTVYSIFRFSPYRYRELGSQKCCITWLQKNGFCRNVL